MTAHTPVPWTPYAGLSRMAPLAGGERVQVFEKGEGRPLLYLHGSGLQFGWNDALEELARSRRVIAPLFAGFGESSGVEQIDGILDAVVYLNDVLDALSLERTDIVAFDLGGMLAAELAAVTPARVCRLVLVAPFGLWDEAHEIPDFFRMPPAVLGETLFADPNGEAAKRLLTVPEEPAAALEYTVQRTRALATCTRFLWPLPDRGLRRRLHRITAPTLLIWGRDDRLIPPAYAAMFREQIRDARVEILDGGHMLPLEQGAALAEVIRGFVTPPPGPPVASAPSPPAARRGGA
jgi:pimeloyl-ACP methyl ester carboxylesterase